jgi:hypothetical protein
MKSGLAVVVAFSAILGRAGQLECLITTIIGVIGFELLRQTIQENIGVDAFGTMIIFTYGGFMSLALGIFCYLRERREEFQIEASTLRKYTGDQHSVLYSLMGTLFIFIFFPFLAYEVDAYMFQNKFVPYISTLIIVISMAAGLIGGLVVSAIINGYIIIRDVTHGLVAGAIAVGAGSLYIINPTFAIITGFIAGGLQALIQNLGERSSFDRGVLVSTVSWSLFGIQGFIGGCFAAGWKLLAIHRYSSSFSSSVLYNHGSSYEFWAMLVSLCFGLVAGALAGVFVYCTNVIGRNEYFDDGYYWRNSDGIRTLVRKQGPPLPYVEKVERKVSNKKDEPEYVEGQKSESVFL